MCYTTLTGSRSPGADLAREANSDQPELNRIAGELAVRGGRLAVVGSGGAGGRPGAARAGCGGRPELGGLDRHRQRPPGDRCVPRAPEGRLHQETERRAEGRHSSTERHQHRHASGTAQVKRPTDRSCRGRSTVREKRREQGGSYLRLRRKTANVQCFLGVRL